MTRAGARWGPGEEVRLGVGDPGGGREVGVLDARSGGGPDRCRRAPEGDRWLCGLGSRECGRLCSYPLSCSSSQALSLRNKTMNNS